MLASIVMRWKIETEDVELRRWLARIDDELEGPAATPREERGRKRLHRIERPGAPAVFVKSFRVPRGWSRLLTLGRASKAVHEARTAREIMRRGFEVAAPLAVGEERRAGLLHRAISVIEERPHPDLRSWLLTSPDVAARRRVLESFARYTRELHDAGIDQDDTSPNNFLVDPEELVWVAIDFERCTTGGSLNQERRWTLIAKLHRHRLGISAIERLRFLRAYLGANADRTERRHAWGGIQQAFLRIRRNDVRRAAKGAFQEGRHLSRDGTAWVVVGREQVPTVRLNLNVAQGRNIWTLTHVFERLDLPALRPVRLDGGAVDLAAPDLDPNAMEFHSAVARARARFKPYGRWVRDPRWELTPNGAVLLTPSAFKIELH